MYNISLFVLFTFTCSVEEVTPLSFPIMAVGMCFSLNDFIDCTPTPTPEPVGPVFPLQNCWLAPPRPAATVPCAHVGPAPVCSSAPEASCFHFTQVPVQPLPVLLALFFKQQKPALLLFLPRHLLICFFILVSVSLICSWAPAPSQICRCCSSLPGHLDVPLAPLAASPTPGGPPVPALLCKCTVQAGEL